MAQLTARRRLWSWAGGGAALGEELYGVLLQNFRLRESCLRLLAAGIPSDGEARPSYMKGSTRPRTHTHAHNQLARQPPRPTAAVRELVIFAPRRTNDVSPTLPIPYSFLGFVTLSYISNVREADRQVDDKCI